jgi:hypothetical protein
MRSPQAYLQPLKRDHDVSTTVLLLNLLGLLAGI